MQFDDEVIFQGLQRVVETDKSFLFAVPDLKEVDRDHCDLGQAMWIPKTQIETMQMKEPDGTEETNSKGQPILICERLVVSGWIIGKKAEEWEEYDALDSAQVLLYAVEGVERDVVDKINKRTKRRRKF